MYCKVSRFVSEIPRELLNAEGANGKRIPAPNDEKKQPVHLSSNASSAREILREKPKVSTVSKAFSGNATSQITLSYAEGDRVHHIKFGDGTVRQIQAGGRDYEVTVDFDRFGAKKMFASFAKLKKI